jgi:replicative DNA helicase
MSSIDQKFLALVSQDSALFGKSLKLVDATFFKGPYVHVFKMLNAYYTKHHRLPSLDHIEEQIIKHQDKILGGKVDAEKFALEFRTLASITDKQDHDFLLEEVRTRRGYDVIQETLPQVISLANEHKIEEAAEILVTAGNGMKTLLQNNRLERTSNHDYIDSLREDYFKAKQNPEVSWGFRTGFSPLDNSTYGLGRGEVFIIGARPGNGKSVFLLSAAINMWKAGKNVLYVSIEMPTKQMWDRAIACFTGIEINKIKEGKCSEEEEKIVLEAFDKIKAAPNRFEILDAPNVTVPTIASELDQMVDIHKPDVLFVDYLGIVRPTEKGLQDNLAQASVIEEIRSLARTRKIGIFSAVQLNRDPAKGKGKTKGLERISRSDVIGHTVDFACVIEEFDVDEELTKLSDKVNIFVIKNRKGRAPFSFPVRKNFACAQFLDWEVGLWNGNTTFKS